MPDTLEGQLHRREFLAIGLAVAGGAVTLQPGRFPAARHKELSRWAFLSDTHIPANSYTRFRGFYPYRNLQRVTAEIASDLPDGLVVAGDLTRSSGRMAAYENLKTLLAPIAAQRPIYLGLGNHDNRENFLRAFSYSGGRRAIEDKHIVTVNAGPVRVVILDTLLYSNMFPGMIGKSQRRWLDTYLRCSDNKPTILCLHHSPRADLLDTHRLFDIVAPARQVKAIVFGHSHKYHFSEFDGIHLINLPATGYNFTGAQPVGWVEAHLTARGGKFVLHAVGGNLMRHGRPRTLAWRT